MICIIWIIEIIYKEYFHTVHFDLQRQIQSKCAFITYNLMQISKM